MKRKIGKILRSLQKAPERKHYLEFVTAALSIPVLITVIMLNLNSLNAKKTSVPNAVAPTPQTVIIHDAAPNQMSQTNSAGSSATPAISPTTGPCNKQIGPISISYPSEGVTITDNPVNFIISYDDSTYCSVVWSYRINNGSWSEYTSNSPSIYNMPNGPVTFDLRVQSTVTQDQTQLTRKFNYQGQTVPTPTITPTPTANLTSTPTP